MTDDVLRRTIERIDERTARLAEGQAALVAKLDDIKADTCRHDAMLTDHASTIAGIRTVAKVGGWLGGIGGAAGLWGMIKGFFAGAQ